MATLREEAQRGYDGPWTVRDLAAHYAACRYRMMQPRLLETKKPIPQPIQKIEPNIPKIESSKIFPDLQTIVDEIGSGSILTIRGIRKRASIAFGFSLLELDSSRRARNVIIPRHAMIWLIKTLTSHSLLEIGRRCGGRDHTTVIYAIRQTEKRMDHDSELRSKIYSILLDIIN